MSWQRTRETMAREWVCLSALCLGVRVLGNMAREKSYGFVFLCINVNCMNFDGGID